MNESDNEGWTEPAKRLMEDRCWARTGQVHDEEILCGNKLPCEDHVKPHPLTGRSSSGVWPQSVMSDGMKATLDGLRFPDHPVYASYAEHLAARGRIVYGIDPGHDGENIYMIAPKYRQTGLSRTQQILAEAFGKGVSFDGWGGRDMVREGQIVQEILDLDDANRAKHPEQYPEGPIPYREELIEARGRVEHLTQRVAKLSRDSDEAHARARTSEAKLMAERDQVTLLKAEKHGLEESWEELARAQAALRSERDEAQNALEALRVKLMEAQRDLAQPQAVVRRLTWILFVGLLACLAAALLTGCSPHPEPGPCGETESGVSCGCGKKECVTPCGGCCKTVPCPIEGCAEE